MHHEAPVNQGRVSWWWSNLLRWAKFSETQEGPLISLDNAKSVPVICSLTNQQGGNWNIQPICCERPMLLELPQKQKHPQATMIHQVFQRCHVSKKLLQHLVSKEGNDLKPSRTSLNLLILEPVKKILSKLVMISMARCLNLCFGLRSNCSQFHTIPKSVQNLIRSY